jgi:peptidoglycan hydrolase-like protein with peptidoglycan-binding domain
MAIGDSHDLKSSRFAGDEVLEACNDNKRVLQRGDSGSAVQKVQQALIVLGIPVPRVGANGIFGDETELAVRSYQEARGLRVDGVIGAITIRSLDEEFLTGVRETLGVPLSEPYVSEVPSPLVPESPVKSPRMSPVSPPEAPEAPTLKAPRAPHVGRPAVKIPQPPVIPVAEPPILTTQTVPPDQRLPRISEMITPPVAPHLLTDREGRKFHSAGTWRGDISFEAEAGKSIRIEISNPGDSETKIQIKVNTGEVADVVLKPQAIVDLEFSMAYKEPFLWRFYVETDRKESLVNWRIYSNWVPGEPE